MSVKTIKYITAALVILAAFNASFAQEFKKNGTAGFVFLEIPVSARTAALGESSLPLADMNSNAIFNNPAALNFSELSQSFSVTYAPWFVDIKNYAASYSYKSGFGSFALGVVMLDYGTFDKTVVAPDQSVFQKVGTFSAHSLGISLGYSKQLTDKFSFGVTLKYAEEKIDIYTASNVMFDGGVLYYTGFSSLRLAASIRNFGVDAKFINDEFKMPAQLRFGLAMEVLGDYNSEYRLTAITEAVHPINADERLNVGLEAAWNNMVILRGGYKFFYDEESYSIGVGLNWQSDIPIALDVAVSDYGRLGTLTRLSLNLGMF